MDDQRLIFDRSGSNQKQIRGLASISIAILVMGFTAFVLVWDDPFQSAGNNKPAFISIIAGIIGMLVAVSDMSEWRKSMLTRVGLALNVLAVFIPATLLPYI